VGKQSRIIAALFAGWCVVGTAYWSLTVPLVPDWSIELRGRPVEFSGDASAPVVMRLWRDNQLKEPIEIIEPADILHSRRALFAGDRPYLLDVKQYNLALINRAGRLLAIDLKTDRVISDLGSTESVRRAVVAADGKVVLVERDSLEGFELATGRSLWKSDRASGPYGSDVIDGMRVRVSSRVVEQGVTVYRITSVDAWTGGAHPWLAGIGPYQHAVDSPGGKYVLVTKLPPDGSAVHDAETGRLLWRLPVHPGSSTPDFSLDGEELVLQSFGSVVGVTYLRWKSDTGEALPPVSTYEQLGRLIGRSHEEPSYRLKSSSEGLLDQLLNKLEKLLQKPVPFRNQPTFVLEEFGSKRQLGMITTITSNFPEDYPTKWIGGPAQVLVQTATQLNYYSKTPRRNWVLLVICCLGPPLLVAVTMYCLDSLRRRFKRNTTTPAASPDSTVGRLAAQRTESTSSPDPASGPRETR